MLLWHDRRIDDLHRPPDKFDVTASLASLDKACCLEAALDFAERLRPKPHLLQPRSCALWGDARIAAVRNEVPAPPSDWQEPLLRFRLGWRHRPRDSGKHTNFLLAKQPRQTVASSLTFFQNQAERRSGHGTTRSGARSWEKSRQRHSPEPLQQSRHRSRGRPLLSRVRRGPRRERHIAGLR